MKADADPGRAREFEVLAIALLVAMAVASASDFLTTPTWPTLVDTSPDSEQHSVLIDPWIPEFPDQDPPPVPMHGRLEGDITVAPRS
jgi:hypothetical protein